MVLEKYYKFKGYGGGDPKYDSYIVAWSNSWVGISIRSRIVWSRVGAGSNSKQSSDQNLEKRLFLSSLNKHCNLKS